MEKQLRIGEVAKLTGLNPKTIRYYEAIQVVPKPRRTVVPHSRGYRLYSGKDLRRLAFVRQAKLLDLSLREIRELVTTAEESCCTSITPKVLLLVQRKLGEIDKRISELEALRRSLTRLRQTSKESLVKPQARDKGLVLLPVPCHTDTCENR